MDADICEIATVNLKWYFSILELFNKCVVSPQLPISLYQHDYFGLVGLPSLIGTDRQGHIIAVYGLQNEEYRILLNSGLYCYSSWSERRLQSLDKAGVPSGRSRKSYHCMDSLFQATHLINIPTGWQETRDNQLKQFGRNLVQGLPESLRSWLFRNDSCVPLKADRQIEYHWPFLFWKDVRQQLRRAQKNSKSGHDFVESVCSVIGVFKKPKKKTMKSAAPPDNTSTRIHYTKHCVYHPWHTCDTCLCLNQHQWTANFPKPWSGAYDNQCCWGKPMMLDCSKRLLSRDKLVEYLTILTVFSHFWGTQFMPSRVW